ncbi:MAG TPA: pyridoxamine 5'-phosphate oxidase family protein [Nocardioides sp.]|nr:pyridoxamine 5'-phosphate oxidase family protein [Nocardioides sp.]
MSIKVDVGELAKVLSERGSGYLVTTSSPSVKVVTVDPVIEDSLLRVAGPGGGTLANVAANPVVTLVFPPVETHGYTLLVDGTAEVAGEDVVVTPATAVLHRPGSHADGPLPPDGCGQDCAPVGG